MVHCRVSRACTAGEHEAEQALCAALLCTLGVCSMWATLHPARSAQPFGGMSDFMAPANADVVPVAVMISGGPQYCCDASQEAMPLVLYFHLSVVCLIVPIS